MNISEKWRTLFKKLPGYDPIATREDCIFDEAKANDAVDYIETCCVHIEGRLAGKPYILSDHEKAIAGCLDGWRRPDGTRRYREALVLIPRKNSKTTFGACLADKEFFMGEEQGGQLYSAAADRDQASLIYKILKLNILREPLKAKRSKPLDTTKTIVRLNPSTGVEDGTSFKSLSSEASTKHGLGPSFALIDELHAHPTPELVEVIETGTGARSQPLVIGITTQDFQRPNSICLQKYEYACKVRDGAIKDKAFLPAIWEATKDDDWHSEETWAKANPNLGKSVSIDFLRREHLKACENPAYENTFKRLYLNMITEQDVRLIPMDRWNASAEISAIEAFHGETCYCGLDLAATTDLAAFVALFSKDGKYYPFCKFWMPEEAPEHGRSESAKRYLNQWAREGFITKTPGSTIDYEFIVNDIVAMSEVVNVAEVACDRWNATGTIQRLRGEGIEAIEFGQGYASMSGPTKELLRIVAGGHLVHSCNPVLTWMASNVAGEQDAAGNIKPSKAKSAEKIDGIVALIMALGRTVAQATNGYLPESWANELVTVRL